MGDNARPPCKAWKWEEKGRGQCGHPCLTSWGIHREPGDGGEAGYDMKGQYGGKGGGYKGKRVHVRQI